MGKRTETIKVAGEENRQISIYRTVHGPVFSPFPLDPRTAKKDRVYTKKAAHWLKEPLSGNAWIQIMLAQNASDHIY
jgi:acyl-homoserine lactone acylase PvdQ